MIKILFVDDESHVLDGLRRGLRRQRKAWDMSFALGGEVALKAIDGGEFDVIVSDMRMPHVDGYAVLHYAQEKQPDAMRIILTGQASLETALRAVPVAHQFLSKPCDGEQIKSVIDRACTMRDLFTDQELRKVVSKAGTLPSSPTMYVNLTTMLEDPETSAADVAGVIEKDIGMCAKILQVVNSAFFGLPRELKDLREAVMFLGVDLIRSMVLSEEAFRPFRASGQFTTADLEAQQARAQRVAILARKLAPTRLEGGQAYLGGMLHEIGWLIAGCMLPEQYAEYEAQMKASDPMACDDRRRLQSMHASIGAFFLGTWGLPMTVVESVAFHHDPGRVACDEFEVISAVHVAAALADEDSDSAFAHRAPCLDLEYIESLGLTDKIEEWRAACSGMDEDAGRDAA